MSCKFKCSVLLLTWIMIFTFLGGCRTSEQSYEFMQPSENIQTIQIVRYYEEWDKYPEEKPTGEIPPSPEIMKVLEGEERDSFFSELLQIPSYRLTYGEPDFIGRGDTHFNGRMGIMIVYQDGSCEISLGSMRVCYYSGRYYNRVAVNSFDTEALMELIGRYS